MALRAGASREPRRGRASQLVGNTKVYSSTCLAMEFANVRAGTRYLQQVVGKVDDGLGLGEHLGELELLEDVLLGCQIQRGVSSLND